MTNGTNIVVGLTAIAALAAGFASRPHSPEPPKAAFGPNTMAALETLKEQLNRRFTDRQNVDFGMSRVIRPGERLHSGPVAGIVPGRDEFPPNRKRSGNYQVQIDGVWIDQNKVRPSMHAENAAEKQAISVLRDGEVDAAIYTVGQFSYDQGETPVDPGAPVSPFTYWSGKSVRAKGPAYLTQKAPIAPAAWQMVDFGRRAWSSGQTDFEAAGPNGWRFFAHRVNASDKSCIACHSAQTVDPHLKYKYPSPEKVGDGIGLFVIALKLK